MRRRKIIDKKPNYFNVILGLFNVFGALVLLFLITKYWKVIDLKFIIIGLYVIHINFEAGIPILNKEFQKE